MLRAWDAGCFHGGVATKRLRHGSAAVRCRSQWSCWLHTGSALQRSQTPTKPNATSKRKQLQPSSNAPEQRSSQPTEQQVQEVDWDQGLIKSDHDAQFAAFCWCREAENSFRRYQPRDEQAPSSPQSEQDVRDGNRDPTSRALDTSWHEMNGLILISVFVCPAPNLSQQHESLPCPAPASRRDTTSSPSSQRAHRGSSAPHPGGFPTRSRAALPGWPWQTLPQEGVQGMGALPCRAWALLFPHCPVH